MTDENPSAPSIYGVLSDISDVLQSLPHAKNVQAAAPDPYRSTPEDFLHRLLPWLEDYQHVDALAKTTSAQMAVELTDWRTFQRLHRALLGGPQLPNLTQES